MQHIRGRALDIFLIITLLFAAYFLRDYFTLIIISIIIAFLFYPVYRWLEHKLRGKSGLASSLTIVIAILTVAIPLAVILAITIAQAAAIVSDISKLASNINLSRSGADELIAYVNRAIDTTPFGSHVNLTTNAVIAFVESRASQVANFVLTILKGTVTGVGSFITNVIISFFVLSAIFQHKDRIIDTLKKLNPFGDRVADLYLSRAGTMTTAMIRGQFVIAVMQGVLGATFLSIAGMDYFVFFALILTVLSMIPLGGGILTIPIGIGMILVGNIWQGVFVLLTHFLVITNIDNFIRPKLVPASARLNPALTILGVFAGISMFGFIGIVLGPVVMILIVTTIEVYIAANAGNVKQEIIPATPRKRS